LGLLFEIFQKKKSPHGCLSHDSSPKNHFCGILDLSNKVYRVVYSHFSDSLARHFVNPIIVDIGIVSLETIGIKKNYETF
jgi:hypothetical protein